MLEPAPRLVGKRAARPVLAGPRRPPEPRLISRAVAVAAAPTGRCPCPGCSGRLNFQGSRGDLLQSLSLYAG
ncbi:hypothetical protein Y1Q_0015017 [Alligator mississippiensis]|uniref:Uncharacterized protein n=1 Tax=Alligator mississippiensis TaxID=8496 RepID=A0A151N8U4_ALLMI|nr:hypothetical protein Y1Q_0015017 [Alligator mississippiensis]